MNNFILPENNTVVNKSLSENKPKRKKCKTTKDEFRYSNEGCLVCSNRKECYDNTIQKYKDEEADFRVIPWELMAKYNGLSSGAKIIGGIIWCSANTKKIKIEGTKKQKEKNEDKIWDRGDIVQCPLTHAEIKTRWRRTNEECLRRHIVSLEKRKLIERWDNGKVYISIGNYKRYVGGEQYETRENGLWEKGLVINSVIYLDDDLSDTEKIVIAGLRGFPRYTMKKLAEKLGISWRTIMTIKKKFNMRNIDG
jgi:hypothetical protein